eukprot:13112866-Heterocapsa_arctica.AAC.1
MDDMMDDRRALLQRGEHGQHYHEILINEDGALPPSRACPLAGPPGRPRGHPDMMPSNYQPPWNKQQI